MPLYFENRIVARPTITGKPVRNRGALSLFGLALVLLLMAPGPLRSQNSSAASLDSTSQPTLVAEDEGEDAPRRKLVKWNEFDGVITTVRMGGGFLYEGAAYIQDKDSKQQFDLEPDHKVRDSRLIFSGRLKTKRPITWKAGVMYDGATDSWLIRESGVMIAVPELWGDFFIGRTKEGFSLSKVMNGYFVWYMERQMAIDLIPILADGVRWYGYTPKRSLLWNIGFYTDLLSEGQSFSTYDWQFAVRIAWLPVFSEADGTLLHLGVSGRYGQVNGGQLQVRSRPEANPAPYFIDTGKFPAHHSNHIGWEAYYRAGPWLFGSEYYLHKISSSEADNPLFYGGEVFATWVITGETHAYTTAGGILKIVSPAKTVFEGGPGAWEAVLRVSHLNLDDGARPGGKFWRLTPMINWYLSDNLRLEFVYGFGMLNRFGLKGNTQFFQSRLQILI